VHYVITETLLRDQGFNYDKIIKTHLCNIHYMTLGEAFIKYVYIYGKKRNKNFKNEIA